MNGLFPIIRRKRRPLSVPESLHDLPPATPADVPPIPTKIEPVQVLADGHQAAAPSLEPAESAPDVSQNPKKSSDDDTNY